VTSLSGEFHTDLALPDALTACAEAIHGLGWPIDSVEGKRIVSHAGPVTEGPPTIEVVLTDWGEGTEVRISGSDSEANSLEPQALIGELNRVRDAIKTAAEQFDQAAEAKSETSFDAREEPSATEPREDTDGPSSSWKHAEERVREQVRAAGGTLTLPALQLLGEFELPKFNARAMSAISDLLDSVQITPTPDLHEIAADDSVTLTVEENPAGNVASGPPPGWYGNSGGPASGGGMATGGQSMFRHRLRPEPEQLARVDSGHSFGWWLSASRYAVWLWCSTSSTR
jgi:hypothetical protein